jgi:DNA-binding transcriptional LysR family regulator
LNDPISDREVFLAVVRANGFSRAARLLEMTPAAVSRRVGALERRLGVRLLQRTTRRVKLTAEGARYHEQLGRLLGELRVLEQELTSSADEPSGELRVVAPMSFGQRRLAPLVATFARHYPGVRLTLLLEDRETDLIGEGIDVAVRIAYPSDSSLIGRRIAEVPRYACAAPSYLAAHGTPAMPQDLARHACLHYNVISEREEWRFSGPDGEQAVSMRGVFCSNNGDVLAEAAIQGLGITLLPDFIVAEALEAGRLVRILQDYERPPLSLSVVYPSREHLPAATRRFVDFLVESLGDPPQP